MDKSKKRRAAVVALSTIVALLFTLAIIQQAFNLTPFFGTPGRQATLLLWALTSLNVILLAICGLILLRNLLKLYFERKSQKLGSKFQTKLVFAFSGLAFIPVLFMAFFAYLLLHRNLDKWFSAPIDQVLTSVDEIVSQVRKDSVANASHLARYLANRPGLRNLLLAPSEANFLELRSVIRDLDLAYVLIFDRSHVPLCAYAQDGFWTASHPDFLKVTQKLEVVDWTKKEPRLAEFALFKLIKNPDRANAALITVDASGHDIVVAGEPVYSEDFEPLAAVVVGYRVPGDVLKLANQISGDNERYRSWKHRRNLIRNNYLLWLGLITLLILFSAVWIGLHLSKKITVPIRALAEASNEVSKGNLLLQVNCPAEDELGILVSSFNRMTAQLHESSQKLERTNRDLQSSNQALEEKRRYTEAVLENIPTGVVSIAPDLCISKMNKAAEELLGCTFRSDRLSIGDVFHSEDAAEIRTLIDKASRSGTAAKDLSLRLGGRKLYFAVTASSLDFGDTPSQGFVMVLENLTEVLRAQRANAWKEVARRMAHEIKNPLTPIQLSAERLLRNYSKSKTEPFFVPNRGNPSFELVLTECVQTIIQEVAILKGMVDEFSRFARLPSTSMIPTNLNSIIESTLSSYNGRFNGVAVVKRLSPSIPEIKLDPEQFKRVFVNLFDNALEAMEQAPHKELSILSEFYSNKETVQVIVKDTGHGIPGADKEKLFLPYFSTRKRGTGLGLAIVSRIVADHKGYIHVEDNVPSGTSFVIEIPTR